jgi:hypothetical protein
MNLSDKELFLNKIHYVFKEMRKVENVPLGLNCCNGQQIYIQTVLPLTPQA